VSASDLTATQNKQLSTTSSGVTRIIELEGLRCRSRQGGWNVGRGYPLPYWEKGLDKGLCPLPRKFYIFLLKIPYSDAF